MPKSAVTILAALCCAGAANAQIAGPVAVDGGKVVGVLASDSSVVAFKGIPFAAPPVADLRWKPPQPVVSWEETSKADAFGPICPQLGHRPPSDGSDDVLPPEQSEDCLYLNVWTAAQSAEERRPVMVWIYGGGYRAGSTNLPAYDGEALARKGVVFVSIAYRVGVLGFLAHPELSAESSRHVSGNYGLQDQVAALDWVRRNIDSFGGDPDRITIFGQSAGSMSTSYLAASPLATGKFHRLIGQTGAGFGMLAPQAIAEAERKGVAFAEKLGASTAEELRALDAGKLVAAAGYQSGTFQPIDDGWFVPSDLAEIYREKRQNDVAMLIGSNDDEAGEDPAMTLERYRDELRTRYGADAEAIFALHPASSDAEARSASRRLNTISLGDITMHKWAVAQTATGTAPVYTYRFTRNPPIPRAEYPGGPNAASPGAWHGAEIVYALGNLKTREWPWTAEDRALSELMSSYWINFAATGDPNGPGLPKWPTLRDAPEKVMELGTQSGMIARPYDPTIELLEGHIAAPAP